MPFTEDSHQIPQSSNASLYPFPCARLPCHFAPCLLWDSLLYVVNLPGETVSEHTVGNADT